jgi:hypothetical protein
VQKNYIFPTVPPCMVAASLNCRTTQVQRTEADPISRKKVGGQMALQAKLEDRVVLQAKLEDIVALQAKLEDRVALQAKLEDRAVL